MQAYANTKLFDWSFTAFGRLPAAFSRDHVPAALQGFGAVGAWPKCRSYQYPAVGRRGRVPRPQEPGFLQEAVSGCPFGKKNKAVPGGTAFKKQRNTSSK